MDIDLLKTFISVIKFKSIAKACEEIYLTQPAASKRIKLLEQHYGVKVFERINKKLLLTDEGKLLLDYAYRMVNLYNESMESISKEDKEVKGSLKIVSNLALGIYVLPKLINSFYNIYPNLNIELFSCNTEHIINDVKHGNANFGFIGKDPKDPLIVIYPFYKDKLKVVVGPRSEINKRAVSWKELGSLPFLQREKGSDIRAACEQEFEKMGIEMSRRVEFNSTESIKTFLQCGKGFSILPWSTIEHEVRFGLLYVVKVPHFDFDQNHYICHQKNKTFLRPERVFFQFIFNIIESGTLLK